MGAFAAGEIVLVYFPFSDLSQSKLRPALVLADAGRDDWILCQITSRPYSDDTAVAITSDDFELGSLQRVSFIRQNKLFTANTSLIAGSVGQLKKATYQVVVERLIELIRSSLDAVD